MFSDIDLATPLEESEKLIAFAQKNIPILSVHATHKEPVLLFKKNHGCRGYLY
jgi:3-dehydroquinate dehydratase